MRRKRDEIIRFIRNIELANSAIAVIGIFIILAGTAFLQLFYTEQDCVSCELQRFAFLGAGMSLLMNLRYGNKVVHWACAILSSCAGLVVSMYQILLHINSTRGYGAVIWGFHLYTWSFLCFSIIIILAGLMLVIYPEERR